jgi:DNA-binding beta-propeller fold protein YncE
MKTLRNAAIAACACLLAGGGTAGAEVLAIMTYESMPGAAQRREGIAIMELDRASPRFGQILEDIPLPADLVGHHVYINPAADRAYITGLGRPELRVMDIRTREVKVVPVPDCQVGENVAFSRRTGSWYLTCMGSSVIVVGDMATDRPLRTIRLQAPYPHGIAIHDGIDRILATSTVRPSDLQDPGEVVQELRLSNGQPLGTHRLSNRPSPSGSAPVEVMFVPGSDPPRAYATGMYEGTLWYGEWRPAEQAFAWRQVVDFKAMGQELPLEIYFDARGTRAYVSTAKPGHLNTYDIADPASPRLLHTVATAGGAHHMTFSPDGRTAFVQNSFLNLPGLHDGSITVVDLERGEAVGSIDTLKRQGLTPNNITLLAGGAHGGH